MTWDIERKKSGKTPWSWIEIQLNRCIRTYGVAPCTAALGVTGDFKCYNSWETCQDPTNFEAADFWVRFCEPTVQIPRLFDFDDPGLAAFLPFIKKIDHSPSMPDPGKSLGLRVKFTVELMDAPHHDIGIDKYIGEREFDAMLQGTFIRKLKARWPHYIGRKLRWYQGYITDNPSMADFRMREFVMEKIEGPDAKGRVVIIAKDVLKLLDDDRVQCPVKSKGSLMVALDSTTNYTQIDVTTTDQTEYDLKSGETVDYIRIDREIFQYTGKTNIANGVRLTGVTRSAPSPYISEKAAHEIGDIVQRCRMLEGTIPEVVRELMVDFGGIDASYIVDADWETEADTWLANDTIQRLVTEPEGVKSLIDEIIQQTLVWAFWFDEVDQKIRFRAVHPPDINEAIQAVDDTKNIVKDSIVVKDDPDAVINEIQVLYAQIDPVKGREELENYRRGLVVVDTDSQSANEIGQRRIRRIFCRWHPGSNESVLLRFAERTLAAQRRNLMTVEFMLERKDENIKSSEFVDLTTLYIVNQLGLPVRTRVQILRADTVGEKLKYKAKEDFFGAALFGRWAPEALSGLLYDDATTDQKNKYIFWADSNGKLGAADDPGKTWS